MTYKRNIRLRVRLVLVLLACVATEGAYAFGVSESGLYDFETPPTLCVQLGGVSGPFYDGWSLGISGITGGEFLYYGCDADVYFTDISNGYSDTALADELHFVNVDFLLGTNFTFLWLRMYLDAGVGLYGCVFDGDNTRFGITFSARAGADFILSDIILVGGFYKVRWMHDSGFVDSYGVNIGIAFD